jgi:hypothetical protein
MDHIRTNKVKYFSLLILGLQSVTMHTEIIGTHRTASLSAEVFNAMWLRILLFWIFFLFTRKRLQPVFHQTVYHGLFTLLCTDLKSLIVLFIAILY